MIRAAGRAALLFPLAAAAAAAEGVGGPPGILEFAGTPYVQSLPARAVPLADELGRREGVELALPAGPWAGAEFPLDGADLAGHGALVLEAANPGRRPLRLAVELVGPGRDPALAHFEADLAPGGRRAWRLPLTWLRCTDAWEWPDQPGISRMESFGELPGMRAERVRISAPGTAPARRVRLYRLRADEPVSPTGWVDRYGQRAGGVWPSKVFADAEITAADAREEAELAAWRTPASRDEYQAWTLRPALRASGFFRLERVGGRDWLIAPNGRLYFSAGLNCVLDGIDARLDAAVRPVYAWLPPREGDFAGAWGPGRDGGAEPFWPSFHRVNEVRKWGAVARAERFRERALRRLPAWGFTALGNWSDEALGRAGRLPWVSLGPPVWDARVPYAGENLHDVYDPAFAAEAMRVAASLAAVRDDPWLTGHFLDNEPDWTALPEDVLALPGDRPARLRFGAMLREAHGGLAGVNAAWRTTATSFETLRWPAVEPVPQAAERDAARYRAEFAERYFAAWTRAVRAADPNHLILGGRFQQGQRPDEVVASCGRWCDVVSFNHYDPEPPLAEMARMHALARKPLLVGEYGFNSLDLGAISAANPVADAGERGVAYRYFTEALAAVPYVVGAHYFQYLDEPVTGRFDRETGFNGFVSVADIPHAALVRAAAETNARLYWLHAGDMEPFAQRPRR